MTAPGAHAAPRAEAGPIDITCPVGSTDTRYRPGLTIASRDTFVTEEGHVSGCAGTGAQGITGASFTGTASGTISCLGGELSGPTTFRWNNGRSSEIRGTGQINLKPNGNTVLVKTGEVESGQFEGATIVLTKELLSTDPTACLTEQGVRSASGLISLAVIP
ncbi:hypothetical protein [Streptomyces purpurogeneiscleroticus]|uniref:hypothetical protein n=1 Tax=Streptomyces purpurogeneiscleroticus TaxID=68259 RepID=UPI001CBDF335|nr:hypothetical protein [Streptomyces purpurogeneiscleroticus]MBZ4016409.1 hypothetical protein [Streptomyces purpurogeneiscleroticus]